MSSSEQRPKIVAASDALLLAGHVDTPATGKVLPQNYPTPATKKNGEK